MNHPDLDPVRPGGPPHRSYLFVPGNRPDRFDKALASGADAVILDLEDAVPPEHKDAARAAVAGWLSPERAVVLRINAADTRWFAGDMSLAARPGVAAVMLAKTESAEQVSAIAGAAPVVALIESAGGFAGLQAIAAASRVCRLAFGAIDFQLDMDMHADFDDLVFFRSQLVLASRLAGLEAPIDSPSTALDADPEVLGEAQAARRLGFGAKLCIHPCQVAVVNRSFSPDDAQVAWARRVLEAAGASGGAAVAVDGRMVDKPVILRAEAVLRRLR